MREMRHVTFTINYEQLIKLYRKVSCIFGKKMGMVLVESGKWRERKMNGGIVSHIVE